MLYNKWELYSILGYLPFYIKTEFVSNNTLYHSIYLNEQGLYYDTTLVYTTSWINPSHQKVQFQQIETITDEIFLEWLGLNGKPDQGVTYGL